MPVYFEYAMKVSLCLAIIFLFYTLLLKQITHFTWNRYYLLLFSVFSFIVPLINVTAFVPSQQLNVISFINKIPLIDGNKISENYINNMQDFNYWKALSSIWILVSSILFIRLLIQLLSIRKIISRARLIATDETRIYHLTESILPFSFFNSIFINRVNYNEYELQEIIDHEQVHVQQKHSFDVLIIEMICILNWFNPFAWFIKKAIRENLEFIADNVVLNKGFNRKNYQYLLLKATGNIPSSIASSFTFSSLKTRISMMNKTRTSHFHLLKFALLAPIIMLLLFAFRGSKQIKHADAETKSGETEKFTLSTLTYSIADERAKAIVLKEKNKSLLKTGDILNLKQIFNEKDRLKNLLERNGYNHLKSNAIMFWIDTISVKNSFSIEIHIDAEQPAVTASKRRFDLSDANLVVLDEHHFNWFQKERTNSSTLLFTEEKEAGKYSYLQINKVA